MLSPGIPRGLVTNGLLLSRQRLDRLLQAGLHSITVSLDGPEDAHNWLRRHPESFRRASQAIGMLSREKEIVWDVVSCIKKVLDFIRQTRQEGRIHVNFACEGFLGPYEAEVRDQFYRCHAGISVGSIRINGAISGCPSIRANYDQGNIYQDDFMEVWNNRFEKFRNREWARQGECADCNLFRYCEGNGMHLHDESGKLMTCHYHRL